MLHVAFRGGNLSKVEFLVDGELIKQQSVATTEGHGAILFSIDSSVLPEGAHTVLVRAYDAHGNCATGSTRMQVAAIASTGPLKLVSPRRNTLVQGVVPLQVEVAPTVRSPYVIFLVDNDLLQLTNFAPFTYNWDSAKVTNGRHKITVRVFDGETSAEVQTMEFQVRVDNVGGFTTRQHDTPDLSAMNAVHTISSPAVKAAKEVAAEPALPGTAETSEPMRALGISGVAGSLRHTVAGSYGGMRGAFAAPSSVLNATHTAAVVRSAVVLGPAHTAAVVRSAVVTLPPNRIQPVEAENTSAHSSSQPSVGIAGALADPTTLSDLVAGSKHTEALAHHLGIRRSGSIAAMPGMTLRHHYGASRPAPAPIPNTPAGGTFAIEFNGAPVHFDVAPRVTDGLPLAPFRALFESDGGKIKWFNDTKMLKAFKDNLEIELKIGDNTALVNSQPVELEQAPFLESSRTIVPVSFLRDSLSLNVEFDNVTGHLRITSK
jgi:hypothetical protein